MWRSIWEVCPRGEAPRNPRFGRRHFFSVRPRAQVHSSPGAHVSPGWEPQRQTAVAAYIRSKQLPPVAFAGYRWEVVEMAAERWAFHRLMPVALLWMHVILRDQTPQCSRWSTNTDWINRCNASFLGQANPRQSRHTWSRGVVKK